MTNTRRQAWVISNDCDHEGVMVMPYGDWTVDDAIAQIVRTECEHDQATFDGHGTSFLDDMMDMLIDDCMIMLARPALHAIGDRALVAAEGGMKPVTITESNGFFTTLTFDSGKRGAWRLTPGEIADWTEMGQIIWC